MTTLPETVLQFGGGNFLRAFADLFIDETNQRNSPVGRVVVVQSTASRRAALINEQGGAYHVITRGLVDGHVIDRVQTVTSISRGLVANDEWAAVLAVARSPQLRLIISNVTEAGYRLEEADGAHQPSDNVAPASFPAKLLAVLLARYQAGQTGVTVLPCELLDQNADRLLALVEEQAAIWQLPAAFLAWLKTEVYWLNTLVDRIVSGKPADHPLLAGDALLTVAEPFAFWAIAGQERARDLFVHPAIAVVDNVARYALRKVRILNGAHTALVAKALPMGLVTVREAVTHPEVGPWLRRLLFAEIVPTVADRVDGAAEFAEAVMERFANPFLEHKLADIALHHATKVEVRLRSTYNDYRAQRGTPPPLLHNLLTDPNSLVS
ncbi:MAG TPA: tagaturonate reductase [Caldilineaceae bacterium]|nr:tagaturonate reductase [Caldilineaceae bacterium]